MKFLNFSIELLQGETQRPWQVVALGEEGAPLGAKDTEVEFAVEERDLEAIAGRGIAMRLRDAVDDALEAEAPQVIGHLCGGKGPPEEGLDLRPEIAVAESSG